MNCNQLFELADRELLNHKPFVIYRKAGDTTLNFLIQEDDQLHTTTDFTETGFVFAPFDSSSPTLLIPGKIESIEDCDFKVTMPENASTLDITEKEREQHIQLVSQALKSIEQTSLQKVVLSRTQLASTNTTSPVILFKRLLGKYAQAFVYIWHHPKVGTWLGATPETLLSLKGSNFETMALAGTQKYNGTIDVQWGQKEQEEQALVTQDLVSRLESFDLRNLDIKERETYKAGSLLHLRTCITGRFKSGSFEISKLIKALHPTPAVCGLPRDEAQDFIKSYEPYDRSFYTGFLGELNKLEDNSKVRNRRNVENLAYKTLTSTTRLFVNLRCMQFKSTASEIYVGGGITKDSVPEDEWEETVNKAQTIASIL